MRRCAFIAALTAFATFAVSARAHEVRPAYLELREVTQDTFDVLWKVPARGNNLRLGIYVRFPANTEQLGEPRGVFADDAYIERWRVRRSGGFDGQVIHIEGLSGTRIDVLARVEHAEGVTQTARIVPAAPSFAVEAAPTYWGLSATYLVLGIEHILLGIDHLLFVLALMLLVSGWKRLMATITAFTVAHSITLAAATFGWINVPGPPVEACIALSIVFVAAEFVRSRQGHLSLTERAPWIVAFTFGLLHGLGFAGALSEVGLPQNAIPLALLFFNVGVELGQLMFVAAILCVRGIAGRVSFPAPTWGWRIAPYAIGAIAMFWVIERTSAFFA